jgi:diaminohydroxyphosphoribosylaminopyrimidine deaminase/5-amino-6-(5-phosphoribosylamino)uracil reductase
MQTDDYWMHECLKLARQGWGRTNPNPLVGCVIVREGQAIAFGYHARLGEAHAEQAALQQAREAGVDVRGATLYVNLEPCSHHGRTPPCARAIVEAGLAEVVVAMVDPNPHVAGQGIHRLETAGIKVRRGILEAESRLLNEPFIKYITRREPFVLLKSAMTLDGKIAAYTGDSQWISGPASRHLVHHWRDRMAAIMVGSQTVLQDNPSLTTRLAENLALPDQSAATGSEAHVPRVHWSRRRGQDPLRIVIDSLGRIPPDSRVVTGPSDAGLLLATTSRIDPGQEAAYLQRGVHLLKLDGPDGKVDLPALMHELGKMEIDSILLEGGGGLNFAALQAGIVDKVMIFVAPKIIGGQQAPTWVEGPGLARMADALHLEQMQVGWSGEDLLIEGYPAGKHPVASDPASQTASQ